MFMYFKTLHSILFMAIIFNFLAANKIAVVTKVKGVVEVKKNNNDIFSNLKSGNMLGDGDKIRTGKKGFATIIFIDDKSLLKIKENSEAVITGTKTAKSISKKINLEGGIVRATIKKQNTEFVIQTPTSVASVKGTDFWVISDQNSGDKVIGLEGAVLLTNIETGKEVTVTSGVTGNSTLDGQISVEETNPSIIPSDPDDDSSESSELKIFLEGPNGEQKTLTIKYQ